MEVKIKLEIFIRLYNQSLYLSLDIGQKKTFHNASHFISVKHLPNSICAIIRTVLSSDI